MFNQTRLVTVLGSIVGIAMSALPARAQNVRYVDDDASTNGDGLSWSTAYRHLQDALTEASTNGAVAEIRVAQGAYKPDQDEAGNVTPGERTETFQLQSGLAILGGYRGLAGGGSPDDRDIHTFQSILSGDLAENDDPAEFPNGPSFLDNSFRVVQSDGTDNTSVLEGMTITSGNANDEGFVYNRGAGLYVTGSGGPTVTDCTFSRNWARSDGGALFNTGNSTLTSCLFRENAAGDGGGAVYNHWSAPRLLDCRFVRNYASYHGGMHNQSADPTLINCTFVGNMALVTNGGAMANASSDPILINCVFVGNSAVSGGGGISNGGTYGSNPRLTNCILWGNSDDGGMDESAQIHTTLGTPQVNHCCIQGWTGMLGGTGNLGADPLLRDALGPDCIPGTDDDNLRLQAGSPCIDAGSNGAVPPEVTTDLDDNPRFVDDPNTEDCPQPGADCGTPPIVDMGAYEYDWQSVQACCFDDGTCQDLSSVECASQGGVAREPGTQCSAVQCPERLSEACCLPDESCLMASPACCAAHDPPGVPQGQGTTCATTGCEAGPKACCLSDGSCLTVTPAACTDLEGVAQGAGSQCLGDANSNGIDDACEPGAIPAVSERGLIVMTLLLLTAGTVVVGRRRPAVGDF